MTIFVQHRNTQFGLGGSQSKLERQYSRPGACTWEVGSGSGTTSSRPGGRNWVGREERDTGCAAAALPKSPVGMAALGIAIL